MPSDLTSSPDWDTLLTSLPGAHLFQTCAWAQIKSRVGWTARRLAWNSPSGQIEAAAQVLQRTLRLGPLNLPLSILYIPKGPLLDWSNPDLRNNVLHDLESYARQQHAIFIKLDSDIWLGTGIPGVDSSQDFTSARDLQADLLKRGWRFSPDQIQFRNTVWVDLRADEPTLLARMKQKTRYNLRLAERKGIRVRPGTLVDLPLLYQMYAETSVRDGFVIRDQAYYESVWRTFMQAGLAEPLVAEVDETPVAGLIVFRLGNKAWYLYGMSREVHREKMPNVLLQWEAMRRAKAVGCTVYDLWGAPENFVESDPLWGVYRFKEGLGGQVMRGIGAWDYPTSPILYALYTRILPQILNWMRNRGKKRVAAALQDAQ